MANDEHLHILKQGVTEWNNWSRQNPAIRPNLSGANLTGVNLSGVNLLGADLAKVDLFGANLSRANLLGADLNGANLSKINLSGSNLNLADLRKTNLLYADLSGASLSDFDYLGVPLNTANLSGAKLDLVNFNGANLSGIDLSKAQLIQAQLIKANLRLANLREADLGLADLREANLSGANLSKANLSFANLSGTNLSGANLNETTLIQTNLCDADLTHCSIYGVSVWDVRLDRAKQHDLVVTPPYQPVFTVDNLEVAQNVYLLLNNPKIRYIIDTIAKKAVLILGRFTSERKVVLDALKKALRKQGYLPILFDFEKSESQNMTETVSTLAHLSRFIIVDITDPSCSPYEIGKIALDHIKPIQPLFQPSEISQHEFAMLEDLREQYYYVLPTYQYHTLENLMASLQDQVIAPAEQKVDEILKRRKAKRAKSKKM